jgi:hypothetical protein
MTINPLKAISKAAEFKTLLLMIKSEHPCEFLAVDQLCNELILINECNIDSPRQSGEVLDYNGDDEQYFHNKLHELIDDEKIVLRHRPLNSTQTFHFQSMVAFFDIWRDEVDAVCFQYKLDLK